MDEICIRCMSFEVMIDYIPNRPCHICRFGRKQLSDKPRVLTLSMLKALQT
jgi:hypothetical protein